jgi:hypothetical protein
MSTTNLVAREYNTVSVPNTSQTLALGCPSWPGSSLANINFGSSATNLGFAVGFRSTAKYPFNRAGNTVSHPDDVYYVDSSVAGWILGPGRGVANIDQITKYEVLTGNFVTTQTTPNDGGIGESYMYELSPQQTCDRSPCYNLSSGFCALNQNPNSSVVPTTKQIEKIFKPDENSKIYALNGIETYQVKPGVNKQWFRFLQNSDPAYGSTIGQNNLCQTSRIIYKYANIYNPRDIIYQDVFEKYTNFLSLDIDKIYENNFNLINRFLYTDPNIFITGIDFNYGSRLGFGQPVAAGVRGSIIAINNLGSTFRDNAALSPDNNDIFNILLKNNCLDWKVRYVDQNGNRISGTNIENIRLELKNRATNTRTYTDYYTGPDNSPTTPFFNVNNTTRNNIQIGEIYFTIDITDIVRTQNNAKITTYFSYFNNTSGNRTLDKTIRNGVDNTPPLTSASNLYAPPNPPTIFTDKSKFYPDIKVLWNNQDPKLGTKTTWTSFVNSAHDLTVFFDIKAIDPNGGFVVVGNVPNSNQKCFMLFTPNCLNALNCSQPSDCSLNPNAPICSENKCIQCNSTAECKTGQVCRSRFCSDCAANSDCPTGQLCINGLCRTCSDYSECQSLLTGSVCNNGSCVPCSSTLPCPTGMLCVNGVCTNCTDTKDCPTGQLCNTGLCVNCSESNPCATGLVCSSGLCRVCSSQFPCAPGQVCNSGSCTSCSDSVPCPNGQVCNNGTCVNCSGRAPCAEGLVCSSGVCRVCSSLYPCPSGKVCDDGLCVNCSDSVSCPSGKVCDEGSCVNPPTPDPVKKSNIGIIAAGGGIGFILLVLIIFFVMRIRKTK